MSTTNTPAGRAAVLAQYDGFALLARSAAAGAQLDNVRQKHLTSAISWEQLATNGRKWEEQRARRALEQLSAVAATKVAAETPLSVARLDDWQDPPAPRAGRSATLIG
ncbi:MAG TPA: hypothetical protein VIC34_06625 [Croceibacterium sp.]